MKQALLTCKPPLKDDPEYTREIVRIDPSIFQNFELEEFDYVKLLYGNRELKVRVKKFIKKDEMDIVRIKKRYIDLLGVKYSEKVVIEKIEENRGVVLNTFYGYAKDRNERIVRIHQNTLKELGIKSDNNNTVEVFNLDNGGRMHVKALPLEEAEENRIRMAVYMRTLLGVTLGDKIGVRKSFFEIYEFKRFINKIEKIFINFNTLLLKVSEGEDSDEGKNVVRTNKNNIDLIGTENRDIVDIRWQDKNIQCRILENFKEGTNQNNQDIIYICSSERAHIDLDVYDCVRLRRYPNHILKKNIVEPFMGAIITCFGLFFTFRNINADSLWAGIISLFVSLLLFYIILSKVRSQV